MSYQQHPSGSPRDPVAVAVGNASLLGLGYFLIRRRRFGVLGLAGTAMLVVLLITQRRSEYEFAVIGWGLLQVVHGWWLASRGPVRATDLPVRVIAAAVAVVVIGGIAVERYGVRRIDQEAVAAREAGSCDGVREAHAKYHVGHRIADAPRTDRVETDVAACDRVGEAAAKLRQAGPVADTAGLQAGFATLSTVTAQAEQAPIVRTAVAEFTRGLPLKDPCRTAAITTWLRSATGNAVDEVKDLVPKLEPDALLGCADTQAVRRAWPAARAGYLQLVNRYPRAQQTVRARAGVRKADGEIELNRVRGLVSSGRYCATPAKFSPAPQVRSAVNRAVFAGPSNYTKRLPSQWKGTADNSALVICSSEDTQGSVAQTCTYSRYLSGPDVVIDPKDTDRVRFHKIAVPVKVYELRTGRLLTTTTVQIGGTACPSSVSSLNGSPLFSDDYVNPTDSTIQAAYRPLIVRP